MPKVPQKRQTTVLRRRQIIGVLRRLIFEHGSENVTVARIAGAIGVTQGAIYRHFKSKREILAYLIDAIEEDLIKDWKEQPRDSSVLESLDHALRTTISAIQQRKGVSFLVVAEVMSLGDKMLNRRTYEVLANYIAHIREIIEKGVQSGELSEEVDPDTAAVTIFSAIQGFVTLWAMSNYRFSLEGRYPGLWRLLQKALVRK